VRGEFHLAIGQQFAVALAFTMPVLRFCICATSKSTLPTLMP
jgi:hypothetical protein